MSGMNLNGHRHPDRPSIIEQQLIDAAHCVVHLHSAGCVVISVNLVEHLARAEVLVRDLEPLFAALPEAEANASVSTSNGVTVRTQLGACDVIWIKRAAQPDFIL